MLTRVRERLGGAEQGDRGTSLAELVVAMAITTVVGAMALSFFTWTGRSTSNAAENSFTTAGARIAVSTMASTLRVADTPTSLPGATDFRIADPLSRTTIAFFANDNGNRVGTGARTLPNRVVYTASNGRLTESRYRPLAGAVAKATTWTTNYPTTPTVTRTLLTGGVTVRFDYDVLNTTNGTLTRVSDAALATTSAASVASVTVTVTTAAGAGQPAQSFTATAVLTGSTT